MSIWTRKYSARKFHHQQTHKILELSQQKAVGNGHPSSISNFHQIFVISVSFCLVTIFLSFPMFSTIQETLNVKAMGYFSGQISVENPNEAFDLADGDQDGKLDFGQFILFKVLLSQFCSGGRSLEELEQQFDKTDADYDGLISKEELGIGIRDFN